MLYFYNITHLKQASCCVNIYCMCPQYKSLKRTVTKKAKEKKKRTVLKQKHSTSSAVKMKHVNNYFLVFKGLENQT